jgi:dTDP-4-amino-4,6-dideoxygalactose transaminase
MPELALVGGDPIRLEAYPQWPQAGARERELLDVVLASGDWDSRHGQFVRRFETEFAAFQGARYAICVSSGEAALRVALEGLEIERGSEVVLPAYTFVASATAILQAGLVPVFADVDRHSYGLDARSVEAVLSERTAAIMPVHLGGVPASMQTLQELAERKGLAIIEDAAQAWGTRYQEAGAGTIGNAGGFSFHASKNLACGEGGLIVTDDSELAERCRSISNNGRGAAGGRYTHVRLGGNYRLSEFQGAVLCAALERYPEELQRRAENAAHLRKALNSIPGVTCQVVPPGTDQCSWHLIIVRINTVAFAGAPKRACVDALVAEGVPASAGYYAPVYSQPLFDDAERAPHRSGACGVAEHACASEAVWIRHNALVGGTEDALDVARAFEKVQRFAAELAPTDPFMTPL